MMCLLFPEDDMFNWLIQKLQADKDHDGRLTLDEMIENPYAFYGSVFLIDDEDYFHDEFR